MTRPGILYVGIVALGCAASPPPATPTPAPAPVASAPTKESPAPKPAEHQPIGLVLVLDRSGSMTGEKFEQTKRAAVAAIAALDPKDRVAVVVFDSEARVIVEFGEAGRPDVATPIEKMQPGGGTDIKPALDAAAEMIPKDDVRYHIVLMSDGQAPRDGLLELVRTLHDRKISLSTVALGREADHDLLRKLAETGGGTFHDVTLPTQLETIFVQEAQNRTR